MTPEDLKQIRGVIANMSDEDCCCAHYRDHIQARALNDVDDVFDFVEQQQAALSTAEATIARLSVSESTYAEKMALMRGIHKCQGHHMPKDRVQPCCLGSGIALFIQERKNAE